MKQRADGVGFEPHGSNPTRNWWRLDLRSLEIEPKFDVVTAAVKGGKVLRIEYEYRAKNGEVKRRWVRAATSDVEYWPTIEIATRRKEEIWREKRRLSAVMARDRYVAAVASREKTMRLCDDRVEAARKEMRRSVKEFTESYGVTCFDTDGEGD